MSIFNTKKSLISIIVPVYNVEFFLYKSIDSIINQTYKHIEIILVDDGSTDGCSRICDEYRKKYKNVKVIHKQNGGLGSARNAGLDVAKGEYIYFVDSDDYIDPDLVEKVVCKLKESDADCCSFGMVKEYSEDNRTERISYVPKTILIDNEKDRYNKLLYYLLNYRVGWEAWNRIFKADIIRKHNLRFENERDIYAEDLLFSTTYFLFSKKWIVLNDCFYHYVQRNSSLLNSKKDKNNIPNIHRLLIKLNELVNKYKFDYISKYFKMIYIQIMEWHLRDYISSKGIDWVKEEIKKLDICSLPFINNQSYNEQIARFGKYAGYVSVCIIDDDYTKTTKVIESLINQKIQKLDIIIYSKDNAIKNNDRRIRVINVDDLNKEYIYTSFIKQSIGEFMYFVDTNRICDCDFLVRYTDILKYNDCGSCFIKGDSNRFIDVHDSNNKKEIEDLMNKYEISDIVFNKSLLEEKVNFFEYNYNLNNITKEYHSIVIKD